jgi:UDP:flavonoid glycosyltransferase YjiC (YdhE family)
LRVLFAWELGGGLGHLARLAPWLNHFASRGATPLLAARDLHALSRVPGCAAVLTLQAPFLPHGPLQAGFNVLSYPDILLSAGFGDAATLATLVRAWQSVFHLGKIDALVADFSPTAMLAARLARIPVMHVGDGFTIPPVGHASQSFDSGAVTVTGGAARNAVERVLACVNQMLASAGEAAVDSIGSLLAAQETVLATYPEIDHYNGCQRTVPYAGHFDGMQGHDSGWRPVPGPRILAYLKPTAPEFEVTVDVLRRLPAQTRLYASGLVRPADSTAGFGVTWHAAPMAFAGALEGADMVVSNAGHGATCAALLAGRPMCMLPTFHEQLMTARNVEALGAGESLLQVRDPRRIRRGLVRVLEDPGMAAAAQAFAARHAAGAAGAAVRLAEIAGRFLNLVNSREAT